MNEAIFLTGILARLTPTSVIDAEEVPTMPPYIRMSKQPDAATLRRWAVRCRSKGESRYISDEERELLCKVYSSLLELAVTEDWLNGKKKIESTWDIKPEARDLKRSFFGYVADGPARQWDENGKLTATHQFANGDLVGTAK